MLFGVLLAVFTQVFRIGSEVPNYPVLLLFNIVLFGFFPEATITAVTSIVGQESVVRKTQFPRLVIPLAVVLTALFNLGLNLVVVFVFILAWGIDPTWTLAALPAGAGAALRAHHRRLDDRLVAVPPLSRHGDHLVGGWPPCCSTRTPVLYPGRGGARDAPRHHPDQPAGAAVRAGAHVGDRSHGARARSRPGGWLVHLLPAVAIYVATCVLAVWVFRREAPRIAEQL